MKPDYGNWVPKRLLYGLLIAVLITTALLIGDLAVGWAWPWMVLVTILLVISVGFFCYMAILYHAFSFSGGGLMGRVHEYVANRLHWDGRGRLLDVCCGAGALTIRCAKMFLKRIVWVLTTGVSNGIIANVCASTMPKQREWLTVAPFSKAMLTTWIFQTIALMLW